MCADRHCANRRKSLNKKLCCLPITPGGASRQHHKYYATVLGVTLVVFVRQQVGGCNKSTPLHHTLEGRSSCLPATECSVHCTLVNALPNNH